MKIAFAVDTPSQIDSIISHHFGRCPYYVFVELDDNNNVKKIEEIKNPLMNEHNPGDLPSFISKNNANVIIAGGMGRRAVEHFQQLGIEVVTGVEGKISDILQKYLEGSVKGYKPCNEGDANCQD